MEIEKLETSKAYRLNENGSLELIGEIISPEVIISEYGVNDEEKEASNE